MAIKVEVGQEAYTKLKTEILECTYIKRVDVKMSQLEVENLKVIKLDGIQMTLSNQAITGLVHAMGISKRFVDTLKQGFSENKELLNVIIKSIKGKKVTGLTLVYNSKMRQVTNVYKLGTKLIEDSQYFDALEKIISRTPGAYLRNINQKSNGDISAVIANPMLEFQFGGLANEVFTSGMTLDLTAHKMMTSFFTERLICTNGCKTKNKLMSEEVMVGDKVPDFLTAILSADYHINSVQQFKQRLNRCYHTTASLGEVIRVADQVESRLGNYAPILMDEMSINRFRMEIPEAYMIDKNNHCFLKTDISLWDLVNEVTAISSRIEQHRIAVPEQTNMMMQMIGGNCMFKKPDLAPSHIKQIYGGVIIDESGKIMKL